MSRLALSLVAILSSASCSPGAGEPVVGTWTLTGAMNESRWHHSLTVLGDGRVLAAGGYATCAEGWVCQIKDTAEIYDPVTGIWTPTGSMNERRAQHGAVLLRDGRVLVAGGVNPPDTPGPLEGVEAFLSSAELYDPNSGVWARTGEMQWRRDAWAAAPALVPLPNGKVLFVGGYASDGTVAPRAEVYDPATGTWEPTAPLVTGRYLPAVVVMASGEVMVVGGTSDKWSMNADGSFPSVGLRSAEIYDPVANVWEETEPLDRPVLWSGLTLLGTGEVLHTNGIPRANQYQFNDNAEIYNPATRTWRKAHPMLAIHTYPKPVPLPSGRVLLAGGNLHWEPAPFPSEVYDPWRNTWTATPPMRHHRFGTTMAVGLPSGRVLLSGGQTSDYLGPDRWNAMSGAEIFDEGPLPETVP